MEGRLSEQRRLLISQHAREGHVSEELVVGFQSARRVHAAERARRRTNFRNTLQGHIVRTANPIDQLLLESARFQIHEQPSRGVADVGGKSPPASEFPQEPRIDGAEADLSTFLRIADILPQRGDVIQEPLDLASGEVRGDGQTGLASKERFAVRGRGEDGFDDVVGAGVVPDDGVVVGLAGGSVPGQGGFSLVGDADGREARGGKGVMAGEEAFGSKGVAHGVHAGEGIFP
mmetsp:Transcript_23336/g.48427  ORF Transcript_23336/g.48427 Transcript_23336/m.48427 type:complete len:232 (+) Transcript_23336:884-1579(+)